MKDLNALKDQLSQQSDLAPYTQVFLKSFGHSNLSIGLT
jgi:hypothetical protein